MAWPGRPALWAALLALPLAGCAAGAGSVHYAPGEDSFIAGKDLYQSGDMAEAAAALKAYLDATPGGAHAEEAAFLLGLSYMRSRQSTLAAVELRRYIELYPASPRLAEVEYSLAQCYWDESRPAPYDQEKTSLARDELQRFLALYPSSPLQPQARQLLTLVRARLAEKELLNARLYLHLRQPGSTLFYSQRVVQEYSDTPWLPEALYLCGEALAEQGKAAEARSAWSRLVQDCAGTEWAARAQQRLADSAPDGRPDHPPEHP
ncbi:MAG TPA: outer membrane protein assembly factor BamD [Candidatus Saccharimonadales bacterium]|nr:outer membrane protein assembly factor BamD [Candidatus Saccharimonadales bacterium]